MNFSYQGHLASLMIPNSDSCERVFYSHLTPIKDTYNLKICLYKFYAIATGEDCQKKGLVFKPNRSRRQREESYESGRGGNSKDGDEDDGGDQSDADSLSDLYPGKDFAKRKLFDACIFFSGGGGVLAVKYTCNKIYNTLYNSFASNSLDDSMSDGIFIFL